MGPLQMHQISVGPPVLTINKGSTFLVSGMDGNIDPGKAQGAFAADTRFLSEYQLLINGQPWELVTSASIAYDTARLHLKQPAVEAQEIGDLSSIHEGQIGLIVERTAGDGIHERFEIRNYSPETKQLLFQIEIGSDFASLFEVKGGRLRQRKDLNSVWEPDASALTTTYRNQDFWRTFVYRVEEADSRPSYANSRLTFAVDLQPSEAWRARVRMVFQFKDDVGDFRLGCEEDASAASSRRAGELYDQWVGSCTRMDGADVDLRLAYEQAVEDMAGLRMHEHDLAPDVWVPAAGVPWFVTLFGRDSLVVALQNVAVQPRFVEGALRTLAHHQATQRDDWRDAQPGRIMHEIRHGEMAHFNAIPQTPYYGTWDATPLFLILLHEAWLWLADRQLVEDLLPNAEACLRWIDEYGDLDGDGFQEYKTFSSKGYENQGWKDAGNAVVYPDGSQVKQPKGLCELQGYVYAAKMGMAEVFRGLGDDQRASALQQQAAELKRRFNETFWMEDEGAYAFGLDPDKQLIRTMASNAGQCLWTGIVDQDKAGRLAQRLLAEDMWSGWGIRTLSSNNPAYNPFDYQLGSVWPHDNGIIALGLKRYGLAAEANQVARGIIDAASRFQGHRLPEVFAGFERDEANLPVQYAAANVPQAWASGSIFHLLRAILGLQADAPRRILWVHPTLPDWLPWLKLAGLRIGGSVLDISFWRDNEVSDFRVTRSEGTAISVELSSAA